jgi:hypothetical protein
VLEVLVSNIINSNFDLNSLSFPHRTEIQAEVVSQREKIDSTTFLISQEKTTETFYDDICESFQVSSPKTNILPLIKNANYRQEKDLHEDEGYVTFGAREIFTVPIEGPFLTYADARDCALSQANSLISYDEKLQACLDAVPATESFYEIAIYTNSVTPEFNGQIDRYTIGQSQLFRIRRLGIACYADFEPAVDNREF